MRTKDQWLEGLKKMKRNLYMGGEKIARDDERFIPAFNIMGTTFEYASKPEYEHLMTATSHLIGEKINRFCHIHQNTDDLHKKQDMTRMICRVVGGIVSRGVWGLMQQNAIYTVSYEADKENNGASGYHENFKNWLEGFQREDLVGCCAQNGCKRG